MKKKDTQCAHNVILCIGDFNSKFHKIAYQSIADILYTVIKNFETQNEGLNDNGINNIYLPKKILKIWKDSYRSETKNIKPKNKNSSPTRPKLNPKVICKNPIDYLKLNKKGKIDKIYLNIHNSQFIIHKGKCMDDFVYPIFISDSEENIKKEIYNVLTDYNVIGIISYSSAFHANQIIKILKYYDIPILITLATTIEESEYSSLKAEASSNILRLVPSNESQAEIISTAIESARLQIDGNNSYKLHILKAPHNNMYVNNLSKLVYNLLNDEMIIKYFDSEEGIEEGEPDAIFVASYPSQVNYKNIKKKLSKNKKSSTIYLPDSYYLRLHNSSIENKADKKDKKENVKIAYCTPTTNINKSIHDAFLTLYEVWHSFKCKSVSFNSLSFMTKLKSFLTNDIRFSGSYLFRANINLYGSFRMELYEDFTDDNGTNIK